MRLKIDQVGRSSQNKPNPTMRAALLSDSAVSLVQTVCLARPGQFPPPSKDRPHGWHHHPSLVDPPAPGRTRAPSIASWVVQARRASTSADVIFGRPRLACRVDEQQQCLSSSSSHPLLSFFSALFLQHHHQAGKAPCRANTNTKTTSSALTAYALRLLEPNLTRPTGSSRRPSRARPLPRTRKPSPRNRSKRSRRTRP